MTTPEQGFKGLVKGNGVGKGMEEEKQTRIKASRLGGLKETGEQIRVRLGRMLEDELGKLSQITKDLVDMLQILNLTLKVIARH